MAGSRVQAFRHAFDGGLKLVASQPHAKFHAAATVAVAALGVAFRISGLEWVLVILAASAVWMAESMNTAIEFLADEVSVEWRERIKHAKDIAAFAVLAASTAAAAVGLIVFLPRLAALLT